MQLGNLQSHAHAKGGVEVGERFVEQEGGRFAHDRAADGDALALPTRKLARAPIKVVGEVKHLGCLCNGLVLLGLVKTCHAQRESDVLAHRHVRIERVALEHHRKAALCWHDFGCILAIDRDVAFGDVLEAGDQAQERGFPAARRADEHHELAIFDGEVERRNDLDTAETLGNLVELNLSHVRSPYFTAPKVRPRTSCFWLNQPIIRIGAMAMVDAAESLA